MSAADDAARTAVRTAVADTLFVEAGAGSGKTTALVGRIVELVASGTAPIGEIAAITFTEAAAAELRDRVREALERLASGDVAPRLDPRWPERTAQDRAQRASLAGAAVADVDAAAISTLHAFAQRLLREHPLELGLPPMLTVLDPAASAVEFDDRWEQMLDELLDSDVHHEALLRLLVCGVTVDQLRAVAKALSDSWDLAEDLTLQPERLGPIDVAAVRVPLEAALAHRDACTDGDDKLLLHLEGLVGWAHRLAEVAQPMDALELLRDGPPLRNGGGQKPKWSGVTPAEVRDLLTQAQAARDEVLARAACQALSGVLVALRAQTLDAAAARCRQGRLEFHDLLVGARTLLRAHPEAADAIRRRYTHLLIDEFQDTDPIQAELAVRIASGPGGTGPGDWRDLQPQAGRLFFVGDPKQAIYRFRRADIELFLTVRDRIGGEVLALTRSFRSVPGIVEWVNAVFGTLLGEGDGTRQPAYLALEPVRPAGDGPQPVVLLGAAHDDLNADEVRSVEAADIAATIAEAVTTPWLVGDDQRPARLSDIALLLPTRTALPQIAAALEAAGIPARIEASSLVYQTDEVQELLAVLRAVDDPASEVAVVAALRSSLLGCGDDDLLHWREAHGSWDYTRPAPEGIAADDPVASAMVELHELHERRTWSDVAALVDEVLDRRHVLAMALDLPRPRDLWRRLRFVADQARTFDETTGGDLRSWLRWTDVLGREGAKVAETVLPETDDDAVRILTIHGAKGLEFPITFVCGLGSRPRSTKAPVLWERTTGAIEISIGHATTAGYAPLAEAERAMEDHERLRLLYVATTRAEDHLVVSLHHKAGTPCLAATLLECCDEHPDGWRHLSPAAAARPAGSGPAPIAELVVPDDGPAMRTTWLAARAERLAAARAPRAVAPTTIAREAFERARAASDAAVEADSALSKPEADPDLPPWRRGRAGTSVGRAVHGTLQLVDLASGDGLDAIAASQAAAEQVADRTDDVRRLAAAALASPIVRQAAAGRCFKELYVGAPIGDRVLEGYIDLLVETPDGLVVVDYKTDQAGTDAEIDAKLDRYRLQGAAYAVAVEAALGLPVARCTFVFLRLDGATERDVSDLSGAMDEVRALLDVTT